MMRHEAMCIVLSVIFILRIPVTFERAVHMHHICLKLLWNLWHFWKGKEKMCWTPIFNWFSKIRIEMTSVKSAECLEHPSTSKMVENVLW